MTGQDFSEILTRDLVKVKDELYAYPNEEEMWKLTTGITNSGGTLAIHIVGNLNFFIGAILGNTGYIRDREKEFTERNIEREKIIRSINDVLDTVRDTLNEISEEKLSADYPLNNFGQNQSTEKVLLILCSHLSYHLGQINYHRRVAC